MLMADSPVKGPAGNSFQRRWIYREEPFDFTWSSRGSSQKAGMYFAHSTSTRSCCFMDSHTSLMVAIFFMAMSVLCTGLRDKYWKRNHPAAFGADQLCFITLHSKDSSHQGSEKMLWLDPCAQLSPWSSFHEVELSPNTHPTLLLLPARSPGLPQDKINIPIPSRSQRRCVPASQQSLQPAKCMEGLLGIIIAGKASSNFSLPSLCQGHKTPFWISKGLRGRERVKTP